MVTASRFLLDLFPWVPSVMACDHKRVSQINQSCLWSWSLSEQLKAEQNMHRETENPKEKPLFSSCMPNTWHKGSFPQSVCCCFCCLLCWKAPAYPFLMRTLRISHLWDLKILTVKKQSPGKSYLPLQKASVIWPSLVLMFPKKYTKSLWRYWSKILISFQ